MKNAEPIPPESVFAPDLLLPDQVFSRKQVDTAEKRLWFATLEDAIVIRRGWGEKVTPKIKQDAKEWIESESCELGSFEWCCELVGLSGPAIREAMAKRSRGKHRRRRYRLRVVLCGTITAARER